MRKRLLRLAASVTMLAVASSPAAAFGSGCPSRIVVAGVYACHLMSGTDCHLCHYNCEGSDTYFNMCEQPS